MALLITCTDSSIVDEIHNTVKKDPTAWRQLNEKYPEKIIADSGRYELSQLPVSGNVNATIRSSIPVKNELDGSRTFACIFKLLPANEQRSYEMQGFVINDYQQVLEDKWLATLKEIPVKVNQAVWNKLLASM